MVLLRNTYSSHASRGQCSISSLRLHSYNLYLYRLDASTYHEYRRQLHSGGLLSVSLQYIEEFVNIPTRPKSVNEHFLTESNKASAWATRKQTALDRGQADRIDQTRDLDLDL